MRKTFVAGNWKMNLARSEALELAEGIVNQLGQSSEVEVAICPPSIYLDAVGSVVHGSAVGLGAQNIYHASEGAYTGEISAAMVKDVGCNYVILGHSERRHILGESDQQVNLKVQAALQAALVPIVCVGETLQQREAGQTSDVVRSQFLGSLAGIDAKSVSQVVIAYEPVWAIGTGKVATPEQAEEVHADLRTILETRYNAAVAAQVRIQYGGSVKPDNAGQLLAKDNIDGALVGGASLKVESFLGIIGATA